MSNDTLLIYFDAFAMMPVNLVNKGPQQRVLEVQVVAFKYK